MTTCNPQSTLDPATSPPTNDEPILSIDDPTIPEEIRDHGQRFRKPARYVADLGYGEYILYAEDGEILDLVYLK